MNPLVTNTWLAQRFSDPDIVILDATLPSSELLPRLTLTLDTSQAHSWRDLFDIDELSDHSTPLPHMLPTPEAFSRSMSALGVSDQMPIVIYEQEGIFSAPRAWWMLRTSGHKNILAS